MPSDSLVSAACGACSISRAAQKGAAGNLTFRARTPTAARTSDMWAFGVTSFEMVLQQHPCTSPLPSGRGEKAGVSLNLLTSMLTHIDADASTIEGWEAERVAEVRGQSRAEFLCLPSIARTLTRARLPHCPARLRSGSRSRVWCATRSPLPL